MKKHIITSLSVAIVLAVTVSCQPRPKEVQNVSTDPRDTVVSQNIKPDESGYADINGQKMYYDVYGKDEPLIALRGAYMNIPSMGDIIPMLAKTHKAYALEFQGHGRTNDIDRPITYPNLADDVAAFMDALVLKKADVATLEHTVALFRLLGGGVMGDMRHPLFDSRLAVLPATSHIAVIAQVDLLPAFIEPFLKGETPKGFFEE
jgi:hypothetical protein